MMDAGKLHSELCQFIGCETPTQHALASNVFMSEGIVFLREQAEAYWLLDAIASHYAANQDLHRAFKKDVDLAYLHFWVLTKKDEGAVLTCRKDQGMPDVVTQEIEITDFPFPADGEFKLFAGLAAIDGETNPILVYLPSEY